MMTAIKQHPDLWLPQDIPKQWVVDCRQVGNGEPALEYLSRYLYRGVLPDRDILHICDDAVTFRYKDSRTQMWKTRCLPLLKFLLLILQHVLPKGLQRVRDYGFLRGQNRQTYELNHWDINTEYKISQKCRALGIRLKRLYGCVSKLVILLRFQYLACLKHFQNHV